MNKKEYLYFGIIISLLIAILIIIIVKDNKTTTDTSTYDVSTMHEVSVTDTNSMFTSKKTYVLFVGRSSCSVCESLLPTLKEAQIENNYITQYLDITKIDRSSAEWKTLVNNLDIKTTASISETDETDAKNETNTYGYFLDTYGFTPTVIIISNGKQVDGFIGNKTLSDMNSWLAKNGI